MDNTMLYIVYPLHKLKKKEIKKKKKKKSSSVLWEYRTNKCRELSGGGGVGVMNLTSK